MVNDAFVQFIYIKVKTDGNTKADALHYPLATREFGSVICICVSIVKDCWLWLKNVLFWFIHFQVVEMLNGLYLVFDYRIDRYNVFKVETINETYMLASGKIKLVTNFVLLSPLGEWSYQVRKAFWKSDTISETLTWEIRNILHF